MGDTQLLQQPRRAQVQRTVDLTAGMLALRAGEPRLVDTGRAGQQQVVLLTDPLASGRDQALVQRTTSMAIEVLQTAPSVAELSLFAQLLQPRVIAPGQFAVEQQAQAGSITHLWMRFVGQLVLDDLPGVRVDSLAQPSRRCIVHSRCALCEASMYSL